MRKIAKILPVLMVMCLVFTSVYANISVPGTDDNPLPGGNPSAAVSGVVGNMWATVRTVVQVLAIAAVVFAGLRYMFAPADTKADIKKQMGILALGALLVFAASTILGFVADIGSNIFK